MGIYDDITTIKRLFDAMPPFPVAIWFIDCESEYYQFLNQFEQFIKPLDEAVWGGRLSGVNVIRYTVAEIEAKIEVGLNDEWEASRNAFQRLLDSGQIYPFRSAGCWVQMNKGEHYAIFDNQLIPVNQLYRYN